MKKSRDERMEAYELIDCTMFITEEKLQIAADVIDFECLLFGRWIQHQAIEPYQATLQLIKAFMEAATEVPKNSGHVVFTHRSLSESKPNVSRTMVKWQCKVTAYVDAGRRCLLFSDVADAV